MAGDRRKMIEFIARQLPEGEATLVLAAGPNGRLTATVAVRGDDLDIESDCPEWVTLREIYAHLRWHSMPGWEQRNHLRVRLGVAPAPTSLELIAERLQGVLNGLGQIPAPATTPLTSPEQFLRIRDVAALLGCSYSEARDRLLDGRIRAIRDGRWLRTRREWVEEYVTKKLIQAPASLPEIHVVRVRKTRKAQAVFRKGGAGYEFLKERQRNQRQRGQG